MSKRKNDIPTCLFKNLPLSTDEKKELLEYNHKIKRGILAGGKLFENRNNELPKLNQSDGFYREYRIGVPHPNDPQQGGKKRVVFQIKEVKGVNVIISNYLTDEHYKFQSFKKIGVTH